MVRSTRLVGAPLQQCPKLIDGQAGIANDTAHGERVDWIVAWDRDDSAPFRHADVLAFSDYFEASFLESCHGTPGILGMT